MAAGALTIEQCREALDVLASCGNMTLAASSMGMSRTTFRNGRLLHPELCLVHSEEAGIVEFRGEEFTV